MQADCYSDDPEILWPKVVRMWLEEWLCNAAAKDVWKFGLPRWLPHLKEYMWSWLTDNQAELAKAFKEEFTRRLQHNVHFVGQIVG
jgi:hypothetical protein